MLERFIDVLESDDPRAEPAAATRDRLKARFAPGATRRMTTLGMLLGASLARMGPSEADAIVYASGYGESRALEDFLDTFPNPSPTLFQTSIHPSAVQQAMIGGQRPAGEFMALSGGNLLAFHALRACLLSGARRVLLCGGEETGTWLLEHGLASPRTFAFATALTQERGPSALGSVQLEPFDTDGSMALPELFDLLHARAPHAGPIAPGWRLSLSWFPTP